VSGELNNSLTIARIWWRGRCPPRSAGGGVQAGISPDGGRSLGEVPLRPGLHKPARRGWSHGSQQGVGPELALSSAGIRTMDSGLGQLVAELPPSLIALAFVARSGKATPLSPQSLKTA